MIGFLEESEGVRSMSRLTILLITILAGVVVFATCFYLLRSNNPSAAVIAAMGGLLVTLVVNGVVALIKRNGQSDEPQK